LSSIYEDLLKLLVYCMKCGYISGDMEITFRGIASFVLFTL